jgi:AcrR family transcriptional regulator
MDERHDEPDGADGGAWRGEALARTLRRPHHNRRGQLLRGDGQKTRTRILVEILELLATASLAEVTMANVSKRLGLNAAAFYRYFSDIGEALIAAHECVLDDAEALPPLAAGSATGEAAALALVDGFHRLWRRHGPLLRACNAFAAAGDARFHQARLRLTGPLTEALAGELQGLRPARRAAPPEAAAAVMVMALERAAATPASDPAWPGLRLALAEMIRDAAG